MHFFLFSHFPPKTSLSLFFLFHVFCQKKQIFFTPFGPALLPLRLAWQAEIKRGYQHKDVVQSLLWLLMWEEAAADIFQTVHSVLSPLPHLISMLQVCRRSWRWKKKEADSKLLSHPLLLLYESWAMNWSGPISLFTTSNALSNNVYQSRDVKTSRWPNHLPCGTAGVKSCPAHISICRNHDDVFLLVCRHITCQHTLLKILQQRPGTAITPISHKNYQVSFLIWDLQQGSICGGWKQTATKMPF